MQLPYLVRQLSGIFSFFFISKYRGQLEMVFCAARFFPHEGLLDGQVEVLILKHISRSSTFQIEVKKFSQCMMLMQLA